MLLGVLLWQLPALLWSQCTVDTNIFLQEVDTLNLTIDIEGALNNDLSDPGQGLCKVRINFSHEFLGDLQVFVESPSGQIVQLTGPSGNFGLTQFSEWDVCFLPNSEAPTPDPGFADRWSNNQLWGSFAGTYTGSYHVFFGDLADLDMGPVNGTWTIRFVDRTIFYTGHVLGYQLSFCDSSGVMCRPCEPGIFDFDIPVDEACEGDPSLRFNIESDYSYLPDTSIYGQVFYTLDSNRTIVERGKAVDLTTAEPGIFSLCGLGYYTAHESLLPRIGEDWQDFLDSVRNGEIAICFSTMDCKDIEIYPHSDTTFLDSTICSGDSVMVLGQAYWDSGQYMVIGNNVTGCDSVVLLDLHTIELLPVVVGDTLDCITSEVVLDGSGTDGPAGTMLSWSTADGTIVDTLQPGVILASDPGTYTLSVSFGACRDTMNYEVVQDNDVPVIRIEGDTIDCNNPNVVLTGQTNAQNPAFEWISNGTILTGNDSLVVADSGRYTLRVTDLNGCINEAFYDVVLDTVPPDFDIETDSITCISDSVLLVVNGHDNIASVSWSGPGGIMDVGMSFYTGVPGDYEVTIVGKNGCTDVSVVRVEESLDPPDLSVISDTINCLTPRIDLTAVSSTQITEYSWEGPGGITSNERVLTVDQPGTYSIEVKGANGCRNDTTIEILSEKDLIGISILGDSLDCLTETPKLWFQTLLPFNDHFWRTPAGDQLETDSLDINVPGDYILFIQMANGCIYSDTLSVVDRRNGYDVTLSADTITCDRRMARVWAVTDTAGLSYRWFYRGQEIRRDSAFVTVFGGLYVLEVSDVLGCTFSDSISVDIDTATVDLSITGPDNLTCDEPEVLLELRSSDTLEVFEWTGPGNFSSVDSIILVDRAGVYRLSGVASNGCVSTDSVLIMADTTSPFFELTKDTLTCRRSQGQLRVIAPPGDILYTWQTPDSSLLQGNLLLATVPGGYVVTARDTTNGCMFVSVTNLEIDTMPPDISVAEQQIPCNGDSLILELEDTTMVELVRWIFPDGGEITASTAETVLAGDYEVFVRGINGCETTTEFEVTEGRAPSAVIIPDTLTCERDSLNLKAEWGSDVDSFFWYGDMGFRSTVSDPVVDVAGVFNLVLIGTSGCRDTFNLNVSIDTAQPEVSIIQEGVLGCDSESLFLEAGVTTSNVEYVWSKLPSDSTLGVSRRIEVSEPGVYQVLVTRLDNGCMAVETVVVDREMNSLESIQAEVSPPACQGGFDGSIILDSVIGGVGPYLLNFNGLGFSPKVTYDLLEPGEYSLVIRDAAGCELDTTIVIDDGMAYQLDLGPDTTINAGDTISLIPLEAPDVASRRHFEWSPDASINDILVYSPQVYPLRNTTYTLRLETIDGCILTDDVRVLVDEMLKVFVPNIFTPNGDGLNDQLRVYFGDDVDALLSFRIFDRWGNLVHSLDQVNDQSPVMTWDGTFRGRNSPPGVYAFSMEILTLTGQMRRFSGDLTLIR